MTIRLHGNPLGRILKVSPPDVLWLVAVAAACVPYLVGLGWAPAAVGGDEAQFANYAQSIASTGRDPNGRLLPVFVQIVDPLSPNSSSHVWYQPLLVYLLALTLRALPFTEWAIRLPTALIAVLNVWLVYAVGRRVFACARYAAIAALLMALTPTHLIMSRQALDYICPLPFMLGWLWCLVRFRDVGRPALMFSAGLLLGVGLFSYIAAWLLMPIYFGLTLVALCRWAAPARAVRALSAGFVSPLIVTAPWLWFHPEVLWQTFERYHLPDARAASLDLVQRLSLYWDYFNPSFLFFAGGSDPTQATSRVGVFLLPVAVFLAAGIVGLIRRHSDSDIVLFAGFASAPLPVIVALPPTPEYSIARALVLMPFAALISAHGVERLLSSPARSLRIAAIVLLLSAPMQFAAFLADYSNAYRIRAATLLDPANTRDIVAFVIEQDATRQLPAVYLSGNLESKSIRWRFYLLKSGREDLWGRTQYFAPDSLQSDDVPPGSLLILSADDAAGALPGRDGYSTAATVASPSGRLAAIVLRRDR